MAFINIRNKEIQLKIVYYGPGQGGKTTNVFVADMLASMRRKNILSLKNLHENLIKYHKNIFNIPLLFQFNKVDLSQKGYPVLTPERLTDDLNRQLKRPWITASALTGENVALTLKKIISMTTANIKISLN